MAFFSSKPKARTPTPSVPSVPKQDKPLEPPIQVKEIGSRLEPWVEDVALLYATGQIGETAATLNRYILEHSGSKDILPWLMLFDIHEAQGSKGLFEDLAMDFAVRFERSPPAWSPPNAPTKPAESTASSFSFGAQMTGVDKGRLQHFLREASTTTQVKLDFTGTPAPTPVYARAILECIEQVRKLGKPIDVVGGPAFVVRLNSACGSERGEQPVWLLLLAIEELLGDRNGFEEIALKYAMRFEISPPSYTAPATAPSKPEDAPARPSGDAFAMEGSLDHRATSQLQELSEYAAGRTRIEVDMSRVGRIDFAATGLFLDTLNRLHTRGCQVTVKNCNHLVSALLQLIGADQHAVVLTRKRT